MAEIVIPKFLSHLPTHRGLPVLFTSMWVDGVPDFRVTDKDKMKQAVLNRLCGVCGKRLGEWAWFIGGPKSLVESSLFVDPAMHRKCAEFSISVCPFLSGRTWESNRSRPIPEAVRQNALVTTERSEKIGMRRCREFWPVNMAGHALIQVRKWYGPPHWLA
jgi:hypothetical protein